ncbi:MAG: endonuclease/exonuclease/phosphatase family protein [Candidatus Moraniibacteriota bacterium]
MKIIFLNCWHGKLEGAFEEFLREHVEDTDIFCFQETHQPAYEGVVARVLGDFVSVRAARGQAGESEAWVNETFFQSSIKLLDQKVFFQDDGRFGLALWTHFDFQGKKFSLCNVHGVAQPGGDKLDTDIRLTQSQTLIDFLAVQKDPKIVGGDFNLLPEAKSVHMFEEAGYRDLIKDFAIDTTRNEIAWTLYLGISSCLRTMYFSHPR